MRPEADSGQIMMRARCQSEESRSDSSCSDGIVRTRATPEMSVLTATSTDRWAGSQARMTCAPCHGHMCAAGEPLRAAATCPQRSISRIKHRTVGCALLHPRVHLYSTTRPVCCSRRRLRVRVLLCRSGTHSEGGQHVSWSRTRSSRCTANALLSRTSRVALQAKPVKAANEVRSLALRVGVRGGARRRTRRDRWGAK